MSESSTLGWVKIHRKLLSSEVWDDVTASRILIWLLLMVDRDTGRIKLSREWGGKVLKIKPTTFYKAIKRLQQKFKIINVVTGKMTVKYTEIEIRNWHYYQDSDNRSNNPVTIKGQSSNNPTIYNKNKEERREKREESPTSNFNLLKNQIEKLEKEFPDKDVKGEYLKARDYLKGEGKEKSDYIAWFRNWLRRSDVVQKSDQHSKDLYKKLDFLGEKDG